MRFSTLWLGHVLRYLLLLLLLAALALTLYRLPLSNSIPSRLSPRSNHNVSKSWAETSNPSSSLSSTISNCSTQLGPTTTTAPTSTLPHCLYDTNTCGAIFSLIQTCHDALFPRTSDSGRADDPGNGFTISPTNPAQAARLRSCICFASSSSSSTADKNAAWTHCQSCLHNDLHASQASLVAQTRALQRFCRAPGAPDAVGWLRGFEGWIRELAPGAIGGGGGDGGERRVLSGGVTGVLSLTATATGGGVTAAMQTLSWSTSSIVASRAPKGSPPASVVTSVYWADGETTLLIVKPASSTSLAPGSEAGLVESTTATTSPSSTIHATTAATSTATTTEEQASAAVRGFQGPPVGGGNLAFAMGVGVFFCLGLVRMVLDW